MLADCSRRSGASRALPANQRPPNEQHQALGSTRTTSIPMRATSGDWNWTRAPMLLHARRTIVACHSCSTARISDPPATGDAFRMPGAEAVHELSVLDTSTTTICPNGRCHHVPAAHTYQRGRNHGGCSESPLTKLVSPRKRLCTKVATLVSPWNLMTRGRRRMLWLHHGLRGPPGCARVERENLVFGLCRLGGFRFGFPAVGSRRMLTWSEGRTDGPRVRHGNQLGP
jgi:hypothetical protein